MFAPFCGDLNCFDSYRPVDQHWNALPLLPVVTVVAAADPDRQRLETGARRLTKLGLCWHLLEAAVAVGAGLAAGSVALLGFGADSLIELSAGLVVLWLVTGNRLHSQHLERRAQRLIAASFALLALCVAIESSRDLISAHHPASSWIGTGLSAVTLLTMPPLAAASDPSACLSAQWHHERRETHARRHLRLLLT